jgi:hypothetical protein
VPRRLKAISEFANMGDTVERWHAFNNRWPWLFPVDLFVDSEQEIQRNALRAKKPLKSDAPPQTFAMAPNGITSRHYVRTSDGTWVDYVEPRIVLLRNTLRSAWVGGPDAGRQMEQLLGLRPFVGELLDDPSTCVSVDWRRACLGFLPRNEFQAACYALLEKSRFAKYCANPDCPAPYFVAHRSTQRYCSPDCLKPFQKQTKLDWWNREGKARRAQLPDKSHERKKRKNGPRKTR